MPADMWSSPIWVPVGLAVAILGIFVAWWLARSVRLYVLITGATVISTPKVSRISVLYDGQPVNRVMQTSIWVWRGGRGVVKGRDVIKSDPIRFSLLKGEQILEAVVPWQSSSTNNVSIRLNDADLDTACIDVDFEYIDAGQGFVIVMYHTGESPDAIVVSGTVMGLPRGLTVHRLKRSTMQIPGNPFGVTWKFIFFLLPRFAEILRASSTRRKSIDARLQD